MKDSFVFYRSFYESIKNLDKDTQLEIYSAICEYSLNDEIGELSPVATAIFTLMKPNIDSATKRYNASVENGKKGGRPKKEKPNGNLKKPSKNLEKPNLNLNLDLDDNEDKDVDDNVDIDEDVNIDNSINTSPPAPLIEEEILKEEFEKLWKLYPKKVGKDKSFTKYKKYRTSKGDDYCTYEEVLNGLNRYLEYIKQNSWYSPKDGSTWFNNKSWKDEYEIKEENLPDWFDKEIKEEILDEEDIKEIDKFLQELG